MSAPNVGETSNVRQNLTESIRTFPGNSPGTNPTGTDSTNRSVIGIARDFVLLFQFGNHFFDQKSCILVTQRIVFKTSIPSRFASLFFSGYHTGVDEKSNRNRHFLLMNQIVEDDRHTKRACFVRIVSTILKDHQTSRFRPIVLSRHIEPVITNSSGKDLARFPFVLSDLSFGNFLLRERVGTGFVICIPWCPELPACVPLSLRTSSFRWSEIDEVPSPMLVRIPHKNCEQSGELLRRCVPKLEFGNRKNSV